jgi:molybdopterin-guanine dinucleotide biosynthesis protein A
MDPQSQPGQVTAQFTGVVLAGGRSTRMGRDKASLTIGGERLLDRQVRLLREIGAGRVLVSCANKPDGQAFPAGTHVLLDRLPDTGPLAGIEAALRTADGERVLVLAVDLPGLDADWLRRLWAQSSDRCGVVPVLDRRLEPLAAVYPGPARDEAVRRLDSGRLSVQELVRDGLCKGWMTPWEIPPADGARLVNWNRPGDWCPGR